MDILLKECLVGCKRGETKAQKYLFQRFYPPLYAVCLRYAKDRPEAEDILQEAFIAIFRDLGQYKGEGAFEGWVRMVTVRAALQYLRRKNPLKNAEEINLVSPESTANEAESFFDREEQILLMVQTLPPGYRAVFNLHCMEGYSYAEISREIGIAESSVRSQYARACSALRQKMEQYLLAAL